MQPVKKPVSKARKKRVMPLVKQPGVVVINVLLLLVMMSSGAYGQSGPGPRSVALGSTGVAFVDDAGAAFTNPAGLMGLAQRQIQVQYHLGQPIPLFVVYAEPDYGNGAGSLSWIRDGSIDYFGYSVARSVHKQLSAGIAVGYQKGEYQYLTTDFGLIYSPLDLLSLGLRVTNPVYLGFAGAPRDLSSVITTGVALKLPGDLLATVELNDLLAKDAGRKWRAGLEWQAIKQVALRGGWCQTSLEKEVFSVGFGVEIGGGRLDYALTTPSLSKITPTHYLGLSWSF